MIPPIKPLVLSQFEILNSDPENVGTLLRIAAANSLQQTALHVGQDSTWTFEVQIWKPSAWKFHNWSALFGMVFAVLLNALLLDCLCFSIFCLVSE